MDKIGYLNYDEEFEEDENFDEESDKMLKDFMKKHDLTPEIMEKYIRESRDNDEELTDEEIDLMIYGIRRAYNGKK